MEIFWLKSLNHQSIGQALCQQSKIKTNVVAVGLSLLQL
jgi:hypothetical protein